MQSLSLPTDVRQNNGSSPSAVDNNDDSPHNAPEQIEDRSSQEEDSLTRKDKVSLRLEYMSEAATKLYFLMNSLVFLICVGVACFLIAWTLDAGVIDYITDTVIIRGNVAISIVLLVLLGGYSTFYAIRMISVVQSKKYFGPRRKKLCILTVFDLLVAIIMMVFFLVPNAFVYFVQPCGWFLLTPAISSYIRNIAICAIISNQILHGLTFFPLVLWDRMCARIQRVFTCLIRRENNNTDNGDKESTNFQNRKTLYLGIDLPWKYYIILFFIVWMPLAVLELVNRALYTEHQDFGYCTSIYDTSCYPFADVSKPCQEWQWTCTYNTASRIIGLIDSIWLLIWVVVYLLMLYFSKRELNRLPYRQFRIAHVQLGLQAPTRSLSLLMCLFVYILRLIILDDSCGNEISYATGNVTIGIVLSFMSLFSCHIYCPIINFQKDLKLHAWLQDFAWTEKEISEKLAARPFTGDPCFCIETALKCYYFSMLMYYYEEEESKYYTLDTAMGLYSLEEYKLLWHRKHDVKCLVCWSKSNNTITLSFRGTASMANVKADLKVWRAAYPPVTGSYLLGTRPMVHAGFLQSWQQSGLQQEVHILVQQILSESTPSDQDRQWRIILTGHSLGGAMAELAAYDLAKMTSSLENKVHITCMTYGCPRPGNHAFARQFRHVVSDAWDIVQASDVIARSGKFLFLYKHVAHMVIISTRGDLIVRPSYIEGFVQRGAKQSIKHHLLTSYVDALMAIMKSQFSVKALPGGRKALSEFSQDIYLKELLYVLEEESKSDILQSISYHKKERPGTWRTLTRILYHPLGRELDGVDDEDDIAHGGDMFIATGRTVSLRDSLNARALRSMGRIAIENDSDIIR